MPRIIVLDSFPLSCMGKSTSTSATPSLTDRCRHWVIECASAGHRVCVPAIAYYETLRELERLGATAQIARLKLFCFSDPERFLPLKTSHLEAAARLWAQSRNAGIPTSGNEALDGDVILAAQAQSLRAQSDAYVIATTNVGHLARFVPAEHWAQIAPGS